MADETGRDERLRMRVMAAHIEHKAASLSFGPGDGYDVACACGFRPRTGARQAIIDLREHQAQAVLDVSWGLSK